MINKNQQAILLHDAARLSGLSGHVQTRGYTAAEKIMRMFGGKYDTPRTTSYLYCDSVDACFYFQNGQATCTFTARWNAGAKDLDRLDGAGKLIKKMLDNMQRLADDPVKDAVSDCEN